MFSNYLTPWGRQQITPFFGRDYEGSPAFGFRREMDRLFDDLFRSPVPGYFGGYGVSANWPVIDVKSLEHEVVVTAELPGIKEKDVELFFDKGMLILRGEKKGEKDKYGYSEVFYGAFERQIPLPFSVDAEQCTADYVDGILTVRLPKLAEAEFKKKIPISGTTHH
jgi:HSP20 family protein